MKASYNEVIANHIGPESCVDNRKVADETLTVRHAGQVKGFKKQVVYRVKMMSRCSENDT